MVVTQGSYLVNLAGPKRDVLARSREGMGSRLDQWEKKIALLRGLRAGG